MKHEGTYRFYSGIQRLLIVWLSLLLCCMAHEVYAQKGPKKTKSRASRYSYLPDEYSQVGTTQLYYNQHSGAIDIIGYYNGYYYSSTYSDYGYKLSVQVGSNSAIRVDCLDGTTTDGVTVQPSIEQQGDLARICYAVTNNNEEDVVVSLGTHADVMIGYNDSAPIERRIDTFGQTYGLTMMDGDGAQLCVLFGSGLAGVTAINDFWFGYYWTNSDPYQMVGNYYPEGGWMEENGSYDSGMGWCWKDRTITAGSTIIFSYLIGVGEVNLEPNSSFEVTPDDPEGWNDLSRPHRLSLNGSYESPAGLDGVIDYAVEDREEWIALTDTLTSGEEFTASLVAMFDATRTTHVIRFRTRDLVGNTTMLQPIEYLDISSYDLTGIEDKSFTGDSLFQTNATCDLDSEQYVLTSYRNNVNAGTASFNLEGVFPYTIGRRTYTFTINPQLLSGELLLDETAFVYNGQSFTPNWQFTNDNYAELEFDKDYTIDWSNNKLPGTAILTITGKNNYTGTLSASFFIDKAQLADDLFILVLPEEDITYDEQAHGASITISEGVGEATITYLKQGESESTPMKPTEAGLYTIYLEIADGSLYYGRALAQVGSFAIYQFNADEWAKLQTILPQLKEMGWSEPWDASQGMKSVSSIQGLIIEKGHVTGLDLNNQNLTGAFPFIILTLPQLENIDLSNNNLSGDLGSDAYAFSQQHPEQIVNIKSLNISGNQLSGNVSPFANIFPSLTSLNASKNCFEEVYPTISPSITELDLSKQTISSIVPFDLESLPGEEITSIVPTILLYDHANQTYKNNINLLCTTEDNSWGMTMAFQNGQLSIPYVSDQNTYYGESGDTLNVAVVYYNGTREGSTFRIKLSFCRGDANFVNGVDATDLQATILYAFGNYTNHPFNFTAANTFKDDLINIQDVICTVNILLESSEERPMESRSKHVANVITKEPIDTEAYILMRDGKIILNSKIPVASLSIKAVGDIKWNLDAIGLQQSTSGGNIVGYSLSGATIPNYENIVLGEYTFATLYSASLSDSEAQQISVSLNEEDPTNINSIFNNDANNTDIFGITGNRKNSISDGVNIIKRNGKTIKLYKK